jgi:type II secretory ATPase GspE/PulE/Tfp pilus assembly ATPase PilB-like protein
MPTVLGERVTVRILFKADDVPDLARLGFEGARREALRQVTWQPSGVVAVSGPHGSGKTTTLYAILQDLLTSERPRGNIMTVEEPVEYILDGISQTRVNRRIGLTYAAALRAVLHSDLDVVMIADLSDRETAELAFELAATGHLVLTQLTAKSSLDAIARLRALDVDSFLIAQTLAGSISQRLMRRTCRECQAEYEPPAVSLQRLGMTAADGPFRRGFGCAECRKTGYKGRLAVYEILVVDEPLRQLIADDAAAETLWQATFGLKGGSLWDDAREKVRLGVTTVEEALRVLFDHPRFDRSADAGG